VKFRDGRIVDDSGAMQWVPLPMTTARQVNAGGAVKRLNPAPTDEKQVTI
jgi:hypothetical protein